MRVSTKRPTFGLLAAAAVLAGGLAATSPLHAHDDHRQPGTMMHRPGMTEMKGMMGMMRQMQGMMANCNGMMRGMMQRQERHHPNPPAITPEKKG